MAETEQSLIQRAQQGDHDAFAALVDEHQRYVYNLALRVVKDENEALDLTQETFIRAWTALCRTFAGSRNSVPGCTGSRQISVITGCPTCAVRSMTLAMM